MTTENTSAPQGAPVSHTPPPYPVPLPQDRLEQLLNTDPIFRVMLQGWVTDAPTMPAPKLASHVIQHWATMGHVFHPNYSAAYYRNGATDGENVGPGSAPRTWDSVPPDLIQPDVVDIPPPPLPESIAAVVMAVRESSRCSAGTALAAALGGINVCVTEAYDVQSLARLPVPTALYFVVSSQSGWRKSEAMRCGFSAHEDADRETERRWKEAKARFKADPKGETEPAERSPVSLRDDSTVPALLRALSRGRRSQGLRLTEIATLFNGHSFIHGRTDSMASLAKLWDGVPTSVLRVREDTEFRLDGHRLTMCGMGQPGIVDRVIFSEDSGHGFGPRVLYSADTQRPEPVQYNWQEGHTAQSVIEEFEAAIQKIRSVQDTNLEYADPVTYPRRTIQPTDEARMMLAGYNERCELASDTADEAHRRGFLVRSAEHAARLAANLAGWRLLRDGDNNPKPTYDVDDLEAAIRLVNWYGDIIALRFANASESVLSDAANSIARQLSSLTPEARAAWTRSPSDFNIKGFITKRASGPAHFLRSNAEARGKVIEVLTAHGFLVVTSGGPGTRITYCLSGTVGQAG